MITSTRGALCYTTRTPHCPPCRTTCLSSSSLCTWLLHHGALKASWPPLVVDCLERTVPIAKHFWADNCVVLQWGRTATGGTSLINESKCNVIKLIALLWKLKYMSFCAQFFSPIFVGPLWRVRPRIPNLVVLVVVRTVRSEIEYCTFIHFRCFTDP